MSSKALFGLVVIGLGTLPSGSRDSRVSAVLVDALQQEVSAGQAALERQLVLLEDHSTWANRRVVSSEHFQVETTQSYAFGKAVGQDLESMLVHFQAFTGSELRGGAPMVVRVFPDVPSYNALGEDFAEHSSFYGSFYASGQGDDAIATNYSDNWTLLRMWTTHSALHHYLARAFPGSTIPTWIDEGLASYFSLFWNYGYGVDQFEGMRDNGRLLDLDDLLDGELADYQNRSHERLIQIGMLFTYLINVHPETRTVKDAEGEVTAQPFVDYVLLRIRGRANPASPVRKLLFGDNTELQKAFHSYAQWR